MMYRRTIAGLIFIVGALLKMASMWGIVDLRWLWNHSWTAFIGPVVLLYVGLELVIYSFQHNPSQWLRRPLPQGDDGKRLCCAVRFAADQYVYHGETFHGARLDTFVGGLRFDLRQAVVGEDEEIDIRTYIGGVELLVPGNVKVEVKSHSFIGGVNNNTATCAMADAPCLHITASNFLGAVTIKNE